MYAKNIVRDIDHIDLDDKDARILINAVNVIKNKRHKNFLKSIEKASKIVEKWPDWKRNLL